MELVKLTREELYDQVWNQPMRTLAQHCGISDVGLAKTCRRLRVPVPGRGYWAKKTAGYKVKQTPLPALGANPSVSDREVTLGYSAVPIAPLSLPLPVREQSAFEQLPENLIVVSDSLRSPHPLTRKSTEALKTTGRQSTDFLRNYQESHLDIQVSKELFPRALKIMDALVKAFEERGWKVSLGSNGRDRDRKSYVTVWRQAVPFGIREKLKKVETHATRDWEAKYRDGPSGKLALVLRNRWGDSVEKSLEDTPSRKVEDRLNEFVVAIAARAFDDVEWDARREEGERNRFAEANRRAEEQRRREEEAARVKALETTAANWERSQRLRSFISAARIAAQEPLNADLSPEAFENWVAWAELHAASLDSTQKPLADIIARDRSD